MTTATHTDAFTELMESMDETPACEGTEHGRGIMGHQADQPATHAILWACPHCDHTSTVLYCTGRATFLQSMAMYGNVELDCGHTSPAQVALKRVIRL